MRTSGNVSTCFFGIHGNVSTAKGNECNIIRSIRSDILHRGNPCGYDRHKEGAQYPI